MNLEPSALASKLSTLRRYHQMASVVCFAATVVFQSAGSGPFSPRTKTALLVLVLPTALCGVLALVFARPLGENRCFRAAQSLLQLAAVLAVHKGAADPDTGQQVLFLYLLVFVDRLTFRHHLLRVFFTLACLVWAYAHPRSYVVACLANLDAFVFLLLQASLFRKEARFDWLDSRLRVCAAGGQARTAPLAKPHPSPGSAKFLLKRTASERRAHEFLKLEGEKNYSNPEDCVVMKMTHDTDGQSKKDRISPDEQVGLQADDSPGKSPKEPQRFAEARKRVASLGPPASALCALSRLQRSDSLGAKLCPRLQQSKDK
jgi:hypothetical protein